MLGYTVDCLTGTEVALRALLPSRRQGGTHLYDSRVGCW